MRPTWFTDSEPPPIHTATHQWMQWHLRLSANAAAAVVMKMPNRLMAADFCSVIPGSASLTHSELIISVGVDTSKEMSGA